MWPSRQSPDRLTVRTFTCLNDGLTEISGLPSTSVFIEDNADSILANDQDLGSNPSDGGLDLNSLGYWRQGDPNTPLKPGVNSVIR